MKEQDSERRFLTSTALGALGLVVVMALFIAGCAPAAAPAPATAVPAAPTSAPATAVPAAPTTAPATAVPAAPKVSGQLNYLGWQGYDDPQAFKPFYDQTGVVLNTTYIGNNDELISKYKAGGPGVYDIGSINGRYIQLMVKQGMLMALDESKLPNLKDLFPAWDARSYGIIDGKRYAVPLDFGPSGLCYRADKAPEPGWDFYTKPEYIGKYAVGNGALADTYVWAMTLGLGQDATKWTQDDLAKIKARAQAEFKNAAFMWTGGGGEQKDLLVRGDVLLTTDCFDQVAIDAQKAGANVKFVVPPGPIKIYVDAYFIFSGAKNVDAGYAWINHAISPQAMAIMMKNYGSAMSNIKAYDIDPSLKTRFGFDTLNDTITKAQFNVMPDPDAKPPAVSLNDIYKMFDELKAGVTEAPTSVPAATATP